LAAENAALKQRVTALEAALKEALAQLEAARRAGKRRAAPFSRGERKANPKPPGRKKGHPPTHRAKPTRVDRVLEVKLNRTTCLACGGELVDHTIHVQYQVEIPPVQPVVTQFNIEVARCAACGQRAQARHPEQTSDALGAAAVQIGPRAVGLATEMKHALGVPYRKVTRVLDRGPGPVVVPGTLARAGQRLAAKAEPTYRHLILAVRQSEVVHGDETGWKVAGENAWLWVFTADGVTVYTIDPHRSHGVAERILGQDFQGVLTCDCFLAYNPLSYRQQKCLGHLVRKCGEIRQEPRPPEAIRLSRRVAALLRGAMTLHRRREQMPPEKYARACARLEAAPDRVLDQAPAPTDEAARRLVKLLRRHRRRLFPFLYVAGVAPTNNAAERAIRPAVIVRKMSAGNRSPRGARVHAVVTGLWQTCRRQGRDFLTVVTTLLRSPRPQVIELVASGTPATGPP
jgi:transposase